MLKKKKKKQKHLIPSDLGSSSGLGEISTMLRNHTGTTRAVHALNVLCWLCYIYHYLATSLTTTLRMLQGKPCL